MRTFGALFFASHYLGRPKTVRGTILLSTNLSYNKFANKSRIVSEPPPLPFLGAFPLTSIPHFSQLFLHGLLLNYTFAKGFGIYSIELMNTKLFVSTGTLKALAFAAIIYANVNLVFRTACEK